MADIDTAFWRDLEARFQALHNEQLQDRKKAGLCAHWNSNPANDEPWCLSGGPDDIRTNFEWLAERAAVRLGHSGGPNAVFFWLDLLRGESPYYLPVNSSQVVKGEETRCESGGIELVCKASAEYCLKCETEEWKRKKRRLRMKAFAGPRSDQQQSTSTEEAILRGLAERFAEDGRLPAQRACAVPSLGKAGRTENSDPPPVFLGREKLRHNIGKPTSFSSRSSPNVIMRRAIVQQNHEVTSQGICTLFDENHVTLPRGWLTQTWAKAYKTPEYRSRIQVILSKDKKRTI